MSNFYAKGKREEYLQKFENALPPEFVVPKNKKFYEKGKYYLWTLGVILYYIK